MNITDDKLVGVLHDKKELYFYIDTSGTYIHTDVGGYVLLLEVHLAQNLANDPLFQ